VKKICFCGLTFFWFRLLFFLFFRKKKVFEFL
jgi:hypothetical protein